MSKKKQETEQEKTEEINEEIDDSELDNVAGGGLGGRTPASTDLGGAYYWDKFPFTSGCKDQGSTN